MAELVVGALLGTITSELYTLVENMISKSKKFNPLLVDIKATLDSLKPLIEEIEDENKELNLPNEDIKRFKHTISDGIQTLRECSEDPKWYKKVAYTEKLKDLEEYLKRQLGILTAQGVRDGKETLALARKNENQLVESTGEIIDAVKEIDIGVDAQGLTLFWEMVPVIFEAIFIIIFLGLGVILVVAMVTYIAHSLAKTLPFLASKGILAKTVKYVTRLLFFMVLFTDWRDSIRGTYKGLYHLKCGDIVWLIGGTAYFLYCCLLFLTPLGCQLI